MTKHHIHRNNTLESQSLCLKDPLQWRKVDDQHLPNDREGDRKQKHFVAEEPYGKHRFGLETKDKTFLGGSSG